MSTQDAEAILRELVACETARAAHATESGHEGALERHRNRDRFNAAWAAARALLAAPPEQPEPVARVVIVTLNDGARAKIIRALDERRGPTVEKPWIVTAPEGTLLYTHPASAGTVPREPMTDAQVRETLLDANDWPAVMLSGFVSEKLVAMVRAVEAFHHIGQEDTKSTKEQAK